jgi:hypothetical protein
MLHRAMWADIGGPLVVSRAFVGQDAHDCATGRGGPELARLGISGGAVYDALVGAAARQHGRLLVSGDARARPVYEALGVRIAGTWDPRALAWSG